MNRLLPKEPKWTESAVNPQCMINDFGISREPTPSQQDNTIKKYEEQNIQLRREMKERGNTINNLVRHHKETVSQFEYNMARMANQLQKQAKMIADLEWQKGMLLRNLEEQTRISYALGQQDTKTREVFGNISSTMFLEFDKQTGIIDEKTSAILKLEAQKQKSLAILSYKMERWLWCLNISQGTVKNVPLSGTRTEEEKMYLMIKAVLNACGESDTNGMSRTSRFLKNIRLVKCESRVTEGPRSKPTCLF